MKRAAMIIAMLGILAWGFTQKTFAQNFLAQSFLAQSNDKPAAQNAPAGRAGQAAAPAGKRQPQAKTQDEFAAYKAAAALTDPAARRKRRTTLRRSFRTASCVPWSTSR